MATASVTGHRAHCLRLLLRKQPVKQPACTTRSVSCCGLRRRELLHGFATISLAFTPSVRAAEPAVLPADFIKLERELISSLKESIEIELEGRSESEVRKGAEKAKTPIREFIGKWKYDARVQGDYIFTETSQALEELGQYYLRRGQRASLDSSTANSVLRHLRAAEVKLPEKEGKKFLGIF